MTDPNPYIDKNYVDVICPSGGLTKGQGKLVGGVFGFATEAKDAAATVKLAVTGVHTVPKATSLAIAAGDVLYWDVADAEVNKTAASNYRIGVAAELAASNDTTVSIRLDGTSVLVTA